MHLCHQNITDAIYGLLFWGFAVVFLFPPQTFVSCNLSISQSFSSFFMEQLEVTGLTKSM